MPPEVLRGVAEQRFVRHELAEGRIPAHRVVHPAPPVVVAKRLHLAQYRAVDEVEDRAGPRSAEDPRLPARPERVDPIEERRREIQRSCERARDAAGQAAEQADKPEQRRDQCEREQHVEHELAVGPRAVATGRVPVGVRQRVEQRVELPTSLLELVANPRSDVALPHLVAPALAEAAAALAVRLMVLTPAASSRERANASRGLLDGDVMPPARYRRYRIESPARYRRRSASRRLTRPRKIRGNDHGREVART